MIPLTTDAVMAKFNRDDKFAVNLLLAMYARQTNEEQASQATKDENGIGFNGADAYILSSFADQAKRNRKSGQWPTDLSPKQMSLLRSKMAKYARQMTDLTNQAAAAKAAATDNYYPEPGEQGFRRNPGLAPRDGEPIVAENTGWSFTTGGDNPYGELPPVVHHPLPAHLKAKLDHALMTANTKTIGELADIVMGEEVPVDPASFPSCQLIREGNDLRFPTAKELWRDGGRDSFNAEVTRWSEERNGSGDAVRVGGSPADGADDPFDFGF